MRSSEKLDQLLPALAKARVKFGEIKKTQTNLHFGKPYADLSDILPEVIPALAAEGLILLGTVEPHESGGVLVTERLMHVSEQYLESLILLSYPAGQLQKLGGDITYFRRYADNTMLALSADQDLDDARPEEPSAERRPARKPTPKPVVQVETTPAPMHLNGTEPPIPTGKPTKEETTALWHRLEAVYVDAVQREQIIREVMKIPAGQPCTLARFRLTITATEYQKFLQDVAWAQQTQEAARDQDDVPLTDSLTTPDVPQAEISPQDTEGEPLDAPVSPHEAVNTPSKVSTENGASELDITGRQWGALSRRAFQVHIDQQTWDTLRQGSYAAANDYVTLEERKAAQPAVKV